ncbi:DNA/RNA non-specific endonuclease [Nitrosococcus oceani ATCC 19707]|uniref:DNA/RNA non-specific endonuclease n=2 Tax=Nitrosococcus oceani TaxID=1229 RepID=Q3JA44_NITOC|nr:DNA/RNA non-specific endonuclease [Nitrosococcus oceani]ABA58302.1 DNA/RNA non-specific endonuclease [Nitrosococcus oceani ATCC 19707]EDZ68044.1 DNA/RNA non-specific endonuclease, putative [Nitrosococcus oceani AFC27]KFI19232.1 endonuclease [Nitrosococcus oceani C-27]GEM18686.1 endonuclease [Nitrosococcus oceani]
MARQKKINPFQVFLTVWQLGRQRPLVLLLLVLTSGFWYGYELYIARPGMVYMGVPKAQNWKQPHTWTRIFRNDGFMVGYSDLRGNPLWVSYKVETIPDNAPYYKRPQRFSADWRNLTHIAHDDYRHSGYDRGHMAPNYAISRLYGEQAQLDTFLMTNITPQKPKLNQKLWQRLEEVEINHFTKRFKTIWVFTGPIFDPNIERLKSSYRVEIPDAFYKIYFAPSHEKMLAFIVKQEGVRGKEPLDKFLVSVDDVEKQTGFDFFHELEDTLEEQLESSTEPDPWQLKEVARLPARY